MNPWMILALILVCGAICWMAKKGGCCGIGRRSLKGGKEKMGEKVKDPVCGMEVDTDTAAAKSEHMGKTFYFCAQGCKEKFDQEPMKYMGKEERKGGCCR